MHSGNVYDPDTQKSEIIFIRQQPYARIIRYVFLMCASVATLVPFGAHASQEEPVRATVIDIVSEETVPILGTEASAIVQVLEAATDSGTAFVLENDRVKLQVGDSFFAYYVNDDLGERYVFFEPDRRKVLVAAAFVFSLLTLVVGGLIGFRALIALFVSGVVVFTYLLPSIVNGAHPLFSSVVSAGAILGVSMAITHGISRSTFAAFGASIATVTFAAFLGEAFVEAALLSGFSDDAAVTLNFSSGGTLDLSGVLLAGIIIGVLGIIDDLAMTQVSAVRELAYANANLSRRELYLRAMNVGKEHLGAVTNTLIFAYAGASLPLLLLFVLIPANPFLLVNGEVVATEIIRTAVGGSALALVLPMATILGILALVPRRPS